ncbi:hypothetical protein BDR03DRAFT_807958, partial [Suillus americanus]
SSTTNNSPNRADLKIWQQNLRKSQGAWEHLLRNLDPDLYDIACIQEPYLNPVKFANASNLGRYWDVIYPTNHHASPDRTQTIILINKRLSKTKWRAINVNSPNIMAIELSGLFGRVRIYNVHNPCDHDNVLH